MMIQRTGGACRPVRKQEQGKGTNAMNEQYERRFRKYYDELKWLYCELYENRMDAFSELCRRMECRYRERKEALLALDEKRQQNPQWYMDRGMLGMMMYTDAFAGTLQGVEQKLDYISECGVNYLHLMPLLDSPEGKSDGGYAVSDFRKVNPKLGTMEDLEHLCGSCHDRGISVCLDFVMNHTSEEHSWAKAAKAGDPGFQAYYYFYDDFTIPAQYEQTVPQVFPTTAPGNFTWNTETGKYVMTTFYPYQWDLNYGNPAVLNEMTDNLLFLVNQGVDVIRIDAVPYIWKQLGTNCRNLPQVHNIVRILRIICQIVCPGVLLLGEVVMEPDKIAPYFGSVEKPECHMLYNVTTMATTWNTVATKDVGLLARQMGIISRLPKQYLFLNYLRCHDDIGWGLDYDWLRQFGMEEVPHKRYLNDYLIGVYEGSWARGELYNSDPTSGDARLCGTTASLCGLEAAETLDDPARAEEALRQDLTLHGYMFTQSGVPILYSGDEIGQFNDYSYHEDPAKREDSRYLHRGAFSWENAALRTKAGTFQNELFDGLRKLEKTRAAYPVFDPDAEVSVLDTGNRSVLGIRREKNGEVLTALFSFSGRTETARIYETGTWINLLDKSEGSIVTGKAAAGQTAAGQTAGDWQYADRQPKGSGIVLEAFGMRWLYRRK